jgi:lysyl-tRNA synthetase class 2
MMLKRVMGKACFATLQDMSGRIQLYVTLDGVGARALDAFKHWDLGDIVGASGTLFKTQTGELSVKVRSRAPAREGAAAAAGEVPRPLRPGAEVPAAPRRPHHQSRRRATVRQALADRAGDPRVLRRARLSRGRDADDASDPGGAAARPFARITTRSTCAVPAHRAGALPEAPRRRRLEKVFEINRNFRNEGHLDAAQPEFTMLEFYEAYRDYHYLMDLTEELLPRASRRAVLGTDAITYQGQPIDLGAKYDRLTMAEAIHKYNPRYALAELAKPNTCGSRSRRTTSSVSGRRRGPAAAQAVRGDHRRQARAADVHRRASDRRLAACARQRRDPAVTDRFELFITGGSSPTAFSS